MPLFYNRDADGVPEAWVARVKASIAAFAPRFSTHRMVGDYARMAYEPAAARWRQLREEGAARELAAWVARVRDGWPSVKIYSVEGDGRDGTTAGSTVRVRAELHPGLLKREDLRLDLVYGAADSGQRLHADQPGPMTFESATEDGVCHYSGSFVRRPAAGSATPSASCPTIPAVRNPIDLGLVIWA